jgi:hypothetical protein
MPLLEWGNMKLNVAAHDDQWGLGRVVEDEHWIDLAAVQGFLDNCKRNHKGICEFAVFEPGFDLPRPAWLINIENGCLVKADGPNKEAEYLALSYVRGSGTNYFRLTQDKL